MYSLFMFDSRVRPSFRRRPLGAAKILIQKSAIRAGNFHVRSSKLGRKKVYKRKIIFYENLQRHQTQTDGAGFVHQGAGWSGVEVDSYLLLLNKS